MVARVTVLSVVDAIADDLRNEIMRGELVPGDPLTEAEVSERYDVARATAKATIREGRMAARPPATGHQIAGAGA